MKKGVILIILILILISFYLIINNNQEGINQNKESQENTPIKNKTIENQSLENIEIKDTKKAEFIFHDSEGPNAGGDFSKELGINTIPIFLDNWKKIEPKDNVWNFDEIPENTHEYSHVIVRIGVLHILAWNSDEIPDWINQDEFNEEFKKQYKEFLIESIKQIKEKNISVDFYLVELESNYAGHELKEPLTNQEIIDWIKWESDLIKSLDSNAKIIVALTPTEFRPEESLENEGDYGKILISDFVQRMIESGVNFEGFGFNIASGVCDKVDSWEDLKDSLNKWSGEFDKKIFVWAMGYPADNEDGLLFNNPREEGYSQDWQEEQYVNSLKILLENEKVIGVSIDLYDYQEEGLTSPVHWGLIGGDREKPESLFKRKSFDAVKECWYENYR